MGKIETRSNGADRPTPDETADVTPVSLDAGEPTGKKQSTRAVQQTFVDERDDVLAVINELEDQLDRYEEIREKLEADLNAANEQAANARNRVQELEWQTVTLQTRVEGLEQIKQEVTLLEEEIADANGRASRFAEQLARAEKEIERLSLDLKAAQKELEELFSVRKERDGLRVDIKNLRIKLEQTEISLKDSVEERRQLNSRMQDAQSQLDESRNARRQLELDLRGSEDRNVETTRLKDAIQEKLEAIRGEKKGLQAQLAKLERENQRLVEQAQFYECEITSLRSNNRNAEQALTNVKKAFSEVRLALSETKARARRRTIETFPRTGAALRGHDGSRKLSDDVLVDQISAQILQGSGNKGGDVSVSVEDHATAGA
ncbi:MAG: hypothetical protein KDA32_08165 [Phycisphaerales bacterium]|nr:hypothetical protein [Phycisphaerales bacterium]